MDSARFFIISPPEAEEEAGSAEEQPTSNSRTPSISGDAQAWDRQFRAYVRHFPLLYMDLPIDEMLTAAFSMGLGRAFLLPRVVAIVTTP